MKTIILAGCLLLATACQQPRAETRGPDAILAAQIKANEARITELERKNSARESLDKAIVGRLTSKPTAAASAPSNLVKHLEEQEMEGRVAELERRQGIGR